MLRNSHKITLFAVHSPCYYLIMSFSGPNAISSGVFASISRGCLDTHCQPVNAIIVTVVSVVYTVSYIAFLWGFRRHGTKWGCN